MTDRIVQAPADRSATVDLGRHIFRKPFLRRGHAIDYPTADGKKRRITFDDAYLSNITNAAKAGAFDLVPLILDPGDNKHPQRERPEDFRGRVLGVEETADGLDALVEVNDDVTAKILRDYPDLAVSARLMENYAPDGGGEVYPVAMKHLFVTANPRVAKLGQWQEASLSGHDAAVEILDLSAMEAPMPDRVDLSSAALQERWDALTEDERAELMAIADVLDAETDPDADDDDTVTDSADDDEDETETDDAEGEPVSEDLSGGTPESVDLAARGVIAAQGEEIAGLQQQLHGEQWNREADGLRLDGVPPWALDLAASYLSDRQAAVVDLSGVSDETRNPAVIIRKLLGGMKGQIDLSGPRGYGGNYADNPAMDENELIKDWFASQGHAIPPGLSS